MGAVWAGGGLQLSPSPCFLHFALHPPVQLFPEVHFLTFWQFLAKIRSPLLTPLCMPLDSHRSIFQKQLNISRCGLLDHSLLCF